MYFLCNMLKAPPFTVYIYPHNKYPHLIIILSIIFLFITITIFQFNQSIVFEWCITTINSSYISFPIIIDRKRMLFIFTVSYISFNVLIFSKIYIYGDINISRFTQLVILFIISIILLILSPNLITILLGWDGLGITRFILVIYYQNNKSLKRGFITLITNRIGDALILISITILISQGHWNFLFIWKESLTNNTILSTIIILAAITKRAQFPFSAWLTCAIAAPTPVSALVHSSTLVTAGVYLLIRFYNFLSEFTHFNLILLTSGIITIFSGALWAITKKDIKITIALSTLSQLGLIITRLGLGIVNFCFFHLITHAIFKATIFIRAGIVIFFKSHRQDFSNVKIKSYSRTTGAAILTSVLSINAIFFFAGFYSKDIILEYAFFNPIYTLALALLIISTVMTAIYSTRIYRGTLTTKVTRRNFFRKNIQNNNPKSRIINNNYKIIEFPIFIIILTSLIIGAIVIRIWIFPPDIPIVDKGLILLPPVLAVAGAVIAAFFCPSNKSKLPHRRVFKWLKKTHLKIIKLSKKSNPTPLLPTSLWTSWKIKIRQNLFFKLVIKSCSNKKIKWKIPKLFNSTSQFKKWWHALFAARIGRKFIKKKKIGVWVWFNYKLGLKFLTLSIKIEKYLDQGIYKLIGPSSIQKHSPHIRITTLSLQKNTTPKLLLISLFIIIILLPLIF